MTSTPLSAPATGGTARRGLSWLLLDAFSSVWLGIILAAALFAYCSIGSAVPQVRQHAALEMTEFEWFHWWPFNVLIAAFCANVIVVSVRRIPLRLVNAGVWAVHTGIIVLCIGSYYYFGTKVEGDTPVFRRRIRIEVPGAMEPSYLVALPGSSATAVAGSEAWQFEIQSTNSDWSIASQEHEGEKAFAVNVLVTPPAGDPFVRQLLVGYPQYTEDVVPGKGRAVKLTGNRLLNQELDIALDYEPQEYFHVMDTWALYVRPLGETEWVQRPIEGLPRYHDRIGSRDQVFADPHHPVPLRSIDLPVPSLPGGDALESASVRITGYLRYAHMDHRWRDGGSRPNPVLRASLLSDRATAPPLELVAFDRARSMSQDGMVRFVWLDRFADVDTLPTDARAVLHVAIPDADIAFDVPITRETLSGDEGEFKQIEETDFAYRIRNTQDNLSIPGQRRPLSIAIVDVKSPDGEFTRWVADAPELTRDMHHDDSDSHGGDAKTAKRADPRIRMTYKPASSPVILAAYPRGLYLVVNGPQGRMLGREIEVGEIVEVVEGLSVRADALLTHAVTESKPRIVPLERRQPNADETFSMVRLEIATASGTESRWLRFNRYVFPGEQYAYAGRFGYMPEVLNLPDGRRVEIVFSRQRRPLPSPVALEDFTLDTHVGGYTGAALTIRNYVSRLRFLDKARWTDPVAIQVNSPIENGGYWYFQSNWDKPDAGDPTGGLNFTGLGVGNRNGVYVQLAGCCISAAGMIFAFYVKPLLLRRRRRESDSVSSDYTDLDGDETDERVPARAQETIEV